MNGFFFYLNMFNALEIRGVHTRCNVAIILDILVKLETVNTYPSFPSTLHEGFSISIILGKLCVNTKLTKPFPNFYSRTTTRLKLARWGRVSSTRRARSSPARSCPTTRICQIPSSQRSPTSTSVIHATRTLTQSASLQ